MELPQPHMRVDDNNKDMIKKKGTFTTYYPSGNLRTRNICKNGKSIVYSSFNDTRKEEDLPSVFPKNTRIDKDGTIIIDGDWSM